MEKRIIPSILLDKGLLVKTTRFKKPRYIGDPINTARIFNECEVDELVALDISASRNRQGIDFELIQKLASECFMPLTYGGGVRTLSDFDRLFMMGVEKVAVNSLYHENPDVLIDAIEIYGAQSIVVSIDIYRAWFGKRWKVSYENHSKRTGRGLNEVIRHLNQFGLGEVIVNNISDDGTWCGFDKQVFSTIAAELDCPIVALGGGASVIDALDLLRSTPVSAAALGSVAVYQQKGAGVLVSFPNYEERNDLWKSR